MSKRPPNTKAIDKALTINFKACLNDIYNLPTETLWIRQNLRLIKKEHEWYTLQLQKVKEFKANKQGGIHKTFHKFLITVEDLYICGKHRTKLVHNDLLNQYKIDHPNETDYPQEIK